MKLTKVYPANLKPGMLVVGTYDPMAFRTHVQEMACALRVAEVVRFHDGKSGRECAIAPVWEGDLQGGVVEYSSGVKYLVIEG